MILPDHTSEARRCSGGRDLFAMDNNTTEHGYLTDDQGHPSSMRLMSMVALIGAIMFGLITLLHGSANDENGLYLTAAFLLAAFAPKALQKFAEAKFPKTRSGGSRSPTGTRGAARSERLVSQESPCAYLIFQACEGQDEQQMTDRIRQDISSWHPEATLGGGLKCSVRDTQDFLDLDARLRQVAARFEYTLTGQHLDQDITRTRRCAS